MVGDVVSLDTVQDIVSVIGTISLSQMGEGGN